ncbi:Low molecular weight protein tyrosine phosphatase [Euzebya pacifica]|uniref:protein-tyrosine-phosphatase n=1 Tax=Euzebya pacifica TaxID=1608957 RepID=A0A346XXZ6_9ACTN|nr:Low molecular weight protein tyrosine phosphatase [Euzebya pacifica]
MLMVCLGNICRSPTAEAALREAADAAGVAVEVDSAGTAAYHVGQPPNPPMVAAAGREGLAVSGTARQVVVEDFDRFDLIVAMDTANLADLQHLARDAEDRAKLRLFRDWTDQPGLGVPDPYSGPDEGFTEVVHIVRAAATGLVEALARGENERR